MSQKCETTRVNTRYGAYSGVIILFFANLRRQHCRKQSKRACASPASAWTANQAETAATGLTRARAASRNEKDLLRVGILDLAPRLVARHIDITAVGVVRTENVPRFPGNSLRD